MTRLLLFAVLTATAAIVVTPLVAGAGTGGRLVVAIHGTLSGGTSGKGTFAVDGLVSDHGRFVGPFRAVKAGKNCYSLVADWILTGGKGALTMHGTGTSCSYQPNDARAVTDIKVRLIKGTGGYAGLTGSGTATGVTDFDGSTFSTVFQLQAARTQG